MELGLNGVPEEGQQEAEGGEEDPTFRATEQSIPLFNADRASGRLEKPTRGDKAGGEGQGRVEVEVVSRAIPQRSEGAAVHVPHGNKRWYCGLAFLNAVCLSCTRGAWRGSYYLMSCLVLLRQSVASFGIRCFAEAMDTLRNWLVSADPTITLTNGDQICFCGMAHLVLTTTS